MTDEAPAPEMSRFKTFITGLALLGLGLALLIGGGVMGYRAVMLSVSGVEGQALVKENHGEIVSRRRGVERRNYLYVLEFDGRTLERQMPDLYEVGTMLDITYVPGTVNMELTADRWPLWQAVPVSLVMVLAGLLFGYLGVSVTYDSFRPKSQDAADASPNQPTT